MISPLRCPNDYKSTNVIKSIIEPGSVISTYLFFDGNIELGLSSADRFVVSHTNNYTISEFWACAGFDPDRLVKIIEHISALPETRIFYSMQEAWAKYKDPFVRSAIFFILNRCTTDGMISSGDVDLGKYNPLCLQRLKPLKNLKHFHLTRTTSDNFLSDIEKSAQAAKADYIILPIGRFNYNLFEEGKSVGHEDTKISHKHITSFFKQQKKKGILIYKKHPKLLSIYSEQNIIMVDRHGNRTEREEACEEMIIANF